MVTTAMVGFMAMLAFPEPITKVILTVLTLAAVAYVGWNTLFGIRDGWKAQQVVDAAIASHATGRTIVS